VSQYSIHGFVSVCLRLLLSEMSRSHRAGLLIATSQWRPSL